MTDKEKHIDVTASSVGFSSFLERDKTFKNRDN